jgi:transcription elongation factor GreA
MENTVILTARGLKKLTDELEHLQTNRRREIANRIRDALQFGELAENAEYEDAKKEQAIVEGRILELSQILESAVMLDEAEISTDQIGIGTRVKLKNGLTNKFVEYTIVDPIEADPGTGCISTESPVGRVLMGRKVGEKVQVMTPRGTVQYTISKISKM